MDREKPLTSFALTLSVQISTEAIAHTIALIPIGVPLWIHSIGDNQPRYILYIILNPTSHGPTDVACAQFSLHQTLEKPTCERILFFSFWGQGTSPDDTALSALFFAICSAFTESSRSSVKHLLIHFRRSCER